MKKSIILILYTFLIFSSIIKAQNVIIPDANFKAVLVADNSINTNNDNEIQLTEASSFTGTISVSFNNILDLTGIEAFIGLRSLYCKNNQLTSLDVSANTILTTLDCNFNQLTSLDVSTNIALIGLNCAYNQLSSLNVSTNTVLTTLDCGFNQLSSLDVSADTALIYLYCTQNQLSSLDVTANTALTILYCDYNQLSSLNISTNTALIGLDCAYNQLTSLDISSDTALISLNCTTNDLTSLNLRNGKTDHFSFNYYLDATYNPYLDCIQVDDAAFMTANFAGSKDFSTIYSESCGVAGIKNLLSLTNKTNIYPNPSNGQFTIVTQTKQSQLKIINILGQTIYSEETNTDNTLIELGNQPKGVYNLQIIDENKTVTNKQIVIQ